MVPPTPGELCKPLLVIRQCEAGLDEPGRTMVLSTILVTVALTHRDSALVPGTPRTSDVDNPSVQGVPGNYLNSQA